MTHSAHISEKEVACPCGCGWSNMHPMTLQAAEMIRAWLNGTWWPWRQTHHDHEIPLPDAEFGLRITSGCRCSSHNKAVGGAAESWHLPRYVNNKLHWTLETQEMWDCPALPPTHDNEYKKRCLFAHALDFQVVRREIHPCPECGNGMPVTGETDRQYREHCNTCKGFNFFYHNYDGRKVIIKGPWTYDPAATKAVVDFWKPIWTLGYMYLGEKVCEECGGKGGHMDLKRTDYTGDVPKLHYSPYTCPACQGEGKIYWVHADLKNC